MRYNLGSHAQTAHVWAQNTQSEGHASDKRMFFEGGTIYSYGRHFAIASHVKTLKDESAVLFTTGRYSVSTSKHIGFVRQALRGDNTVFFVPEAKAGYESENLRRFDTLVNNKLTEYAKPRIRQTTRDGIAVDIAGLIESRNAYGLAFVKKYKPIAVPDDITALADKLQKAAVAKAKREAKEKAREFEKDLCDAEKHSGIKRTGFADIWREGRDDCFLMQPRLGNAARRYVDEKHGVLLRLEKDADVNQTIKTSKGAEFPVKHAKLAFKMIQATRDAKAEWHRNGKTIHLGAFQIDSIDKEGNVKAGCHTVKWEEVLLMAQKLGVA